MNRFAARDILSFGSSVDITTIVLVSIRFRQHAALVSAGSLAAPATSLRTKDDSSRILGLWRVVAGGSGRG